jgi:hypothetical protein
MQKLVPVVVVTGGAAGVASSRRCNHHFGQLMHAVILLHMRR